MGGQRRRKPRQLRRQRRQQQFLRTRSPQSCERLFVVYLVSARDFQPFQTVSQLLTDLHSRVLLKRCQLTAFASYARSAAYGISLTQAIGALCAPASNIDGTRTRFLLAPLNKRMHALVTLSDRQRFFASTAFRRPDVTPRATIRRRWPPNAVMCHYA